MYRWQGGKCSRRFNDDSTIKPNLVEARWPSLNSPQPVDLVEERLVELGLHNWLRDSLALGTRGTAWAS
jgi:hypothetical protein